LYKVDVNKCELNIFISIIVQYLHQRTHA